MTFDRLFVPDELLAALSDRAWLAAMLRVESALAEAGGRAGLIPAGAVAAVAAASDPDLYDADSLAVAGRAAGNPVQPLVHELRRQAGEEAAPFVHLGATSQDVLDTAAVLVARDALALIDYDLTAVGELCAELARTYRDTPMPGRTLLQQAVPTTFGCKAAGWLSLVQSSRSRLRALSATLPAELGGSAGTLDSLGADALEVAAAYAGELGLPEAVVPWHAIRLPFAELGAALAVMGSALGKIAVDVLLLSQTEVAEVAEAAGGPSSAMPHKRNAVGAVLARACARRVQAGAVVLIDSTGGEHERAAGAWHAEWSALGSTLAFAGGAAAGIRRSLDGLVVDVVRMRANLDASGGLILSEHVAAALRERGGAAVVAAALARVRADGSTFRDALAAEGVDAEMLDALLDPSRALGAAAAFADRAVAAWDQAATTDRK